MALKFEELVNKVMKDPKFRAALEADPAKARRMGLNGQQYLKDNFSRDKLNLPVTVDAQTPELGLHRLVHDAPLSAETKRPVTVPARSLPVGVLATDSTRSSRPALCTAHLAP